MSNLDSRAPIVVGVDGSAGGDDALDWAVSEASATHRPLRIVHALDAPGAAVWRQPARDRAVDQPRPDRAGETKDYAGATVTTVLARATLRARLTAPDLKIISTAVIAAAVPALVGHAEGAALLVVGNHRHDGHGSRAGRRAGSVALAMTARAPCPVIVVPAGHGENQVRLRGAANHAPHRGVATDRVVVASDGSVLAATATRFAFAVAARRRIGLTVVRAWTPPFAGYPRMVLGLPQLVRAHRQQLLADLAADQSAFPEVEVEVKLVRDKHNHHGRALIEESANATLVVLGSDGHSGFAGLLTDATCQAVLEHAHCPVAVVKPAPATTPTSIQSHVEVRGEPRAQPPVHPAVQLNATGTTRTPPASLSSAVSTEVGVRDGRDVADDVAGDRPPRSCTTGSVVGEVGAVLRWLHSNQPAEVNR